MANKVVLTEEAMNDLNNMFNLTLSTVKEAIDALDQNNKELAIDVLKKERSIDELEKSLRKKHIARLSEGNCSVKAGIFFVDIISNLERIGDHAVNIAETVLGDSKYKYK